MRDALIYAPRSIDTTSSADDLRPQTAHNLGYLLQCAGEDLPLDFEPDHNGVRAPGLPAVLKRINGHFVKGYDDHQDAPFRLRRPAGADAKDFVTAVSTASDCLRQVQPLIDTLSSDDDLERFSVVLWIIRHDRQARRRAEAAVQATHNRSPRNDGHFSTEQITTAWQRLRNGGWGN